MNKVLEIIENIGIWIFGSFFAIWCIGSIIASILMKIRHEHWFGQGYGKK